MEVLIMAITQYSGLNVRQSGNIYEVYLPQGIMVLSICMPVDGQLIKDASVLDVICKVLAKRWGVTKKSSKGDGIGKTTISIDYSGLVFVQVDVSSYQIFLPNGVLVANILFPPDLNYCADSIGLGYVCRAIALRYGIE